jgi:hypothetical protein
MSNRRAKVDDVLRQKWRELGFFYDYDEQQACWRLVGSRAGLLKFCDLLQAYADNPKNDQPSEHDHYGPYLYLEVMTWHEPQITDHAIAGPLTELRRLAALCRDKLAHVKPGHIVVMDREYSASNTARLQFEAQADHFDPAGADPQLATQAL